MNVLSLFSGVGGLELGLERAGMTTVGQVELDPFCRSVLTKHWPEVPKHDDVRTCIDWWTSQPRPPVHAVAGGFPCQPVSAAGLRLGDQDERWLWPEMAQVVDAIATQARDEDQDPPWVIVENVPGLRARGLDTVLGDLHRLGYTARAGVVSACAVGAPHVRQRLFIVAHGRGARCRPGGGVGRRSGTPPVGGAGWPAEPDVDRVAYRVPSGVDRRRALGNAVVPQVSQLIGELVMAAAQQERAA